MIPMHKNSFSKAVLLCSFLLPLFVDGCSLNFAGSRTPDVPVIRRASSTPVRKTTPTEAEPTALNGEPKLLLSARAEMVDPDAASGSIGQQKSPKADDNLNSPSSVALPSTSQRPTADPGEIGHAMATVVVNSLALRRVPLATGPIIGSVRKGDEYPVSALSRDGKWVRLDAPTDAGGRGWVVAYNVSIWGEITGIEITDGFEPENPIGALASNEAVVKTGDRRLRLRLEPNNSAETVFYAFNGELFSIVDHTEDGNWLKLSNADLGVEGWTLRRYLRLAEDPIPTPRPTPTPSPTVLLTPLDIPTATPLPPKTTSTPALAEEITQSVGVADPVVDGVATPTAGATAPADLSSVQNVESESGADVATPTVWPTAPPGFVIVATDGSRLRVRNGPNADSPIVTYVYSGEIYPLLEIDNDGEWVRIEIEGVEGGGWVADQFVITPSE